MLQLHCKVFTDRSYLGMLTIVKGGFSRQIEVSAQSDPSLGAPDPEPGSYRFLKLITIAPSQPEYSAYGPGVMLFAKEGRVVALHGGGGAGELPATESSLRIADRDMAELLSLVSNEQVALEISEERIGLFRQFFVSYKKVSTGAAPHYRPATAPGGVGSLGDDVYPFYWYGMLDDDYAVSYDAAPPDTGAVLGDDAQLTPGGGEFGGAGASGSYDEDHAGEASSQDSLPLIVDPFQDADVRGSSGGGAANQDPSAASEPAAPAPVDDTPSTPAEDYSSGAGFGGTAY